MDEGRSRKVHNLGSELFQSIATPVITSPLDPDGGYRDSVSTDRCGNVRVFTT